MTAQPVDLAAYRAARPARAAEPDPDYSRLACGKVAAARRHLSLDHAGFARLIENVTGWDVLPETIAAWEDDITPPGDVLLACLARLERRGRL